MHHDKTPNTKAAHIRNNHCQTAEQGKTNRKKTYFRLDVILAIMWKYWVAKSLVLDDFKLIVTEQNSQMSEPTYLYCIASLQHM